MIKIANLSKTYGYVQALKNVTLQFEAGMIYGIIGPNGAGKTTLFKCMAGILDYSGEITFEPDTAKNHIGFLDSEPYFLSFITGREYLQLMCNARKTGKLDFDEQNIFELPLDRYATTYSTGMKKKLALMGILLQNNSVFLLDEPFNGVDIQSNLLISEIILKLKSLQKTVIISSHILSTLTDVCDKLIILKDGKIDLNVNREEFQKVEAEMRKAEIGNKLDRLLLS